jgi:hypothetical protein
MRLRRAARPTPSQTAQADAVLVRGALLPAPYPWLRRSGWAALYRDKRRKGSCDVGLESVPTQLVLLVIWPALGLVML